MCEPQWVAVCDIVQGGCTVELGTATQDTWIWDSPVATGAALLCLVGLESSWRGGNLGSQHKTSAFSLTRVKLAQ